MRVLHLSHYHTSPPHPRLTAAKVLLEGAGCEVEVRSTMGDRSTMRRLLTRLNLGFFDPATALRARRWYGGCDMVYILGMRQLLAAVPAKRAGKKVVYEVLDNEPAMNAYNLRTQRFGGVLRWFAPLLRRLASALERWVAARYTDQIVVNSEALCEYFSGRAKVLFYYSPFEAVTRANDPAKPPCLLYLGIFSRAKGAAETLDLAESSGLPLYVYGDTDDEQIAARLAASEVAVQMPRVGVEELVGELSSLLEKHFVLGVCIIHPVHHSYATQEANKDMDYLCIGAPIVGNNRRPTAEKIDAGCGVYFDDAGALEALLTSASARREVSGRCREYYQARYSRARYEERAGEVVGELIGADA